VGSEMGSAHDEHVLEGGKRRRNDQGEKEPTSRNKFQREERGGGNALDTGASKVGEKTRGGSLGSREGVFLIKGETTKKKGDQREGGVSGWRGKIGNHAL